MADIFTPDGKAAQSATIGETFLTEYARQYGDPFDHQSSLADLLADLMHYCKHFGEVEFDTALDSARRHFQAER